MTDTLPPEPAAATLTSAPPAREGSSGRAVEWLAKLGPLIGLVFVFALFSVLVGERFYRTDNIRIILEQTVIIAVAALGMTLIIISGGIDLSVGSAIAVVTVVVAEMLNRGYGGPLSALGGIGSGAIMGLLIGVLITRLKLAPFIITLGAWGAYRGLARGIANEQSVNVQLDIIPAWMKGFLRLGSESKWMVFPSGVYVTLILAILMALVLRYTRFGRHVFAIGSNENTARLCGVHVDRTKILLYTLAGVMTGLAGLMSFSYITQGDPNGSAGTELDIIAAVVIGGASLSGGQGTILGTLTGAVFLTTIANGCTKMGWPNWVQLIATGAIIIVAAALDRLRHRRS
ncbi:MAG TPA: ABC transporter permease [Tepidisphaeraceae bacterium]|jgi:ribose/xylose/arabinose/galactoside ABC-type transport system permease subunit